MKASKVISLLLVVMMCVSMALTGCGEKTANGSNADVTTKAADTKVTAEATTAPAEMKTELEPVELKWYLMNWSGPQKDTDLVFEELSKITKEKFNATIKGEFIGSGDYTDKMNIKIQSGEKFDMCFTCSWALDYYQNAKKGAFAELTDLFAKYGRETLSLIDEKFINGAKLDGKIYAVPTNKELSSQLVYDVNVAVCEKYGIDYAKEFANFTDIAQWEPYFAKVKAGEGKDFVPFVVDEFAHSFVPIDLIANKFGTYFNPNDTSKNSTKIINEIEMPEAMAVAKTMRKYYKAGYLMEDPSNITNTNTKKDALKKSGKWLVRPGGYYPLNEINVSIDSGYKVDVVKPYKPYAATWATTGAMEAISTTSENKERSMMFLNLLNTDKKVRNMVGSGIQDTHFTLKGDVMTQTQQGKDNYMTWNIGIANPIGLLYRVEGEPENKWDVFKQYNADGVPTPTFGFVFDQSPVATEIAAMTNIQREYQGIVFTGCVDPEVYIPKWIEKMKASGSQKIIDEMQKQLDAWLAKQ